MNLSLLRKPIDMEDLANHFSLAPFVSALHGSDKTTVQVAFK